MRSRATALRLAALLSLASVTTGCMESCVPEAQARFPKGLRGSRRLLPSAASQALSLLLTEIGDIQGQKGGQSLCAGSGATTPITTQQPFDSLNSSGLIPLVEAGTETPLSTAINGLRALDDGTRTYIGGRRCVSGASFQDLRKNGDTPQNWDNLIGNYQAVESSRPGTTIGWLGFIQGHQDAVESCEGAGCAGVYGAWMEQLVVDVNTDAKPITGQARDIPVFHSPPSSWSVITTPAIGDPDVAVEVYQAAKRNPLLFLVGPRYPLEHQGDGTHLTELGYQGLGDQYSRALGETLLAGRNWVPTQPISVVATGGNTIRVCFNTPCEARGTCDPASRLAIDETLVSLAHSSGPDLYGLQIEDPNTQPRHLVSATLLTAPNDNCLDLVASGPPQTGTQFTVGMDFEVGSLGGNGLALGAHGSPRSNIRDTATDQCWSFPPISDPAAQDRDCYAWAVHSRDAVTGTLVPPAASDGTLTRDVTWTWAYQADNSFPGTGCPADATWTPLAGSYSIPAVAALGSYTCSAATGAATDADLGANASGEALLLASPIWNSTGNAGAVIDSCDNCDVWCRYIGDMVTPAASEYLLHAGAFGDPDDYFLQLQANQSISLTYGSNGASVTDVYAGALPLVSTNGLLDIHINKRGPNGNGNLAIQICALGTCDAVANAGSSGGSNTHSGQFTLFGASNNAGRHASRSVSFLGCVIGQGAKQFSPARHAADSAALND